MLVYATSNDGTKELLEKALELVLPKSRIESHESVESLKRRLLSPAGSDTVLLVMPDGKEDLEALMPIRNILFNLKTILVLPDKSEETVALGHRLRPSFLSYKDSDFSDVAAVVRKMARSRLYIKPWLTEGGIIS
jgi:hypothetical protein